MVSALNGESDLQIIFFHGWGLIDYKEMEMSEFLLTVTELFFFLQLEFCQFFIWEDEW